MIKTKKQKQTKQQPNNNQGTTLSASLKVHVLTCTCIWVVLNHIHAINISCYLKKENWNRKNPVLLHLFKNVYVTSDTALTYLVTCRRKIEIEKNPVLFHLFINVFVTSVTAEHYMTHNIHIRFPISDIRIGVNKPFLFSTPEYTWLMCGISALSVIVFHICFL